MGDELRQQSWIFDMFILDRIDRELLHSLERLELKFGLSSDFFDKIPLESFLMCSIVCSGFLKRIFMPWHLHS